jgi:hypothetical protein
VNYAEEVEVDPIPNRLELSVRHLETKVKQGIKGVSRSIQPKLSLAERAFACVLEMQCSDVWGKRLARLANCLSKPKFGDRLG